MSDPAASHRREATSNIAPGSIGCAILTISDTRTRANDASGDLIERLVADAGHRAVDRTLVRDEPASISAAVERWLSAPTVAVVLTTGGTGIGRRDTTVEVVRRLLTAELEGFGELFRMLSFEEIGAAAMLSRAVAGLVFRPPDEGGSTFVFAMPGSPNAVETALTRLVLPELSHLVWERGR